VRRALANPRMLFWLGLSALFISVNWLIYIWAVQQDKIFQTSLGYYINPLIYVLVGVLFFGDRLRRLQVAAVISAGIGVAILTISGGEFPIIALSLALLFTFYGVIRKQVAVGAMPGLFVETLLLFPFAMVWLSWLMQTQQAGFATQGLSISVLLMLAGPITVLPLLFFAVAAKRLTLTTVGFMQFLAPTLQFCVGLWYGERLTTPHMICFGLIWLAVVLFSTDAIAVGKKIRAQIEPV
jgi:chloramphenicol-sensitive protein RarD